MRINCQILEFSRSKSAGYIENCFIYLYSDDRLIPSSLAACCFPSRLVPNRERASTMQAFRWTEMLKAGLIVLRERMRSGMLSGHRVSELSKFTAYSMAFSSSRTLPGQPYANNSRLVFSSMSLMSFLNFSLYLDRKLYARRRMSSVLLRRGGMVIGTTQRR